MPERLPKQNVGHALMTVFWGFRDHTACGRMGTETSSVVWQT